MHNRQQYNYENNTLLITSKVYICVVVHLFGHCFIDSEVDIWVYH